MVGQPGRRNASGKGKRIVLNSVHHADRDELVQTLTALIRDVERFDAVLKHERDRLTSSPGSRSERILRERRLRANIARITATVNTALHAMHEA